MSDTPETDHLEDQLGSAAKFSHPVIWKHARQLERERDEARAGLVDLDNMQDQRDFAMKVIKRIERERDEAREQIKELIYISERAIALAEIDFENDKFGVVSELRDGVQRIKEGKK
jgi:hypothetical protein